MNLQGEELEFAVSQYLDGHLSAAAATALEEQLARSADAREILRQYQQVHAKLIEMPALPEVDFSDFASSILTGDRRTTDGQPAVFAPVNDGYLIGERVGAMGGWRWIRPTALAASVLIAITTIALLVVHRGHVAVPAVAKVDGPRAESANGPVIAEVSIGPAPSVASVNRLNRDDAVDRPSIVLIDRADDPPPDGDAIY